MKLLKYKIPIIIFVIVVVFTITLFSIAQTTMQGMDQQDVSYILPFTGLTLEMCFAFFVLWPLTALLGGILGTFLAPVLLVVHKKTLGRNMIYGTEKVHRSEKFKRIFQGLFPGLMAINFSLILSDNVGFQNLMATPWVVGAANALFPGNLIGQQTFIKMMCFLGTITITLIFAFCVFSVLWVFNDSGIVFSNKPSVEKKKTEKPIVGESIGGGYKYVLKGYAGIAVMVTYYELIALFFSLGIVGGLGTNLLTDFVNIYLFLLYFILLPIFTIPAIIVLDVLRDWRVEFTRKYATKLGIVDEIEIKFEKVER